MTSNKSSWLWRLNDNIYLQPRLTDRQTTIINTRRRPPKSICANLSRSKLQIPGGSRSDFWVPAGPENLLATPVRASLSWTGRAEKRYRRTLRKTRENRLLWWFLFWPTARRLGTNTTGRLRRFAVVVGGRRTPFAFCLGTRPSDSRR